MYDFASVIQYEEELPTDALLPQLDNEGALRLGDGERVLKTFSATGITLYRNDVKSSSRFFHVEKTDVAVTLTDRRIVVLCDKYTKGGGWSGFGPAGLAVALTANAVSKAVAARRRKGKVLAGQMWLEWARAVHISERAGFGTENALRLSVNDANGRLLVVQLPLAKATPSRQIGEAVLSACLNDAAARRDRLSESQRAALDAKPAFSAPQKGKLPTANLPWATRASADTAPFRPVATPAAT